MVFICDCCWDIWRDNDFRLHLMLCKKCLEIMYYIRKEKIKHPNYPLNICFRRVYPSYLHYEWNYIIKRKISGLSWNKAMLNLIKIKINKKVHKHICKVKLLEIRLCSYLIESIQIEKEEVIDIGVLF